MMNEWSLGGRLPVWWPSLIEPFIEAAYLDDTGFVLHIQSAGKKIN